MPRTLLYASLVGGCAPASPAKPDPVPPATLSTAPAAPASASEDSDAGLVEVVESDARSLEEVVRAFLRAANSDDDAAARALSSAACWQNECASFAQQAGAKFEARAGKVREQGERAVAHADVICPGERKCDEVELLFSRQGSWQVADITEDEAKAEAWLSGSAPTKRPQTED